MIVINVFLNYMLAGRSRNSIMEKWGYQCSKSNLLILKTLR